MNPTSLEKLSGITKLAPKEQKSWTPLAEAKAIMPFGWSRLSTYQCGWIFRGAIEAWKHNQNNPSWSTVSRGYSRKSGMNEVESLFLMQTSDVIFWFGKEKIAKSCDLPRFWFHLFHCSKVVSSATVATQYRVSNSLHPCVCSGGSLAAVSSTLQFCQWVRCNGGTPRHNATHESTVTKWHWNWLLWDVVILFQQALWFALFRKAEGLQVDLVACTALMDALEKGLQWLLGMHVLSHIWSGS